jgi:L-asparagine transporter-like permease
MNMETLNLLGRHIMAKAKAGAREESRLKWWQLSMLGVACTIGTGYFLGSGLAIEMTGPSVILSFILAAVGTYIVFDVLARMTAEDPIKGSFRSYAKKAYGRWAGFSSGWVYWSSEMLIMGSQLTALSLFSRFWFPNVPMWLFAVGYAILALTVIVTGTKGFERLEHLFAVIKIAAIVMFLVIAAVALFGWIKGGTHEPTLPGDMNDFFPNGWRGMWSSMIFAFYAFGGIEIMGLMAMRLEKPQEAPKAGKMMIMLLTTVYVTSIALAIIILPWKAFHSEKSPFILALNNYNLPFVPHVFNAVLIIAGFSTMVASLFAVTTMLITLAEDNDAPPMFAKRWKRKPLPALGMTAGGLIVSILLALLMPKSLYKYITTAAGLLLLYNWLFILITAGSLLRLTVWGKVKRFAGMALLLFAVSGTLFHKTSRPGFWVSLVFIGVIGLVTVIMRAIWKRHKKSGSAGQRFPSLSAEVESEADKGRSR